MALLLINFQRYTDIPIVGWDIRQGSNQKSSQYLGTGCFFDQKGFSVLFTVFFKGNFGIGIAQANGLLQGGASKVGFIELVVA
ncbi:hypothetical protein CLV98_107203 [Dyadobacter jejuensis]|uniref:Uncharacterized protein n=1 Tax=Dyadobacter jejuensis TaxID=1082580 RepID=A0A316AIA6_9BACT|nr:hypothetical protein CLV98_107203 [Dyadobacter jejuensis]